MTLDTKASREKMAKRTPGEWKRGYRSIEIEVGHWSKPDEYACVATLKRHCKEGNKQDRLNAEAICHAVNIHDALCDEIDRLRAEVERLRRYNAGLRRKTTRYR